MTNLLPWLSILFVQFQFSWLPAAQKVLLRTLAPGELMALRICLSAFLFTGLSSVKFAKTIPANAPKSLPWYLPVLGVVANQGLLIVGISLVGAAVAAIMAPAITLFTYAFAVTAGLETWKARRGFALLVGGIAIIILAIARQSGGGLSPGTPNIAAQVFGIFCILASTACYGGFLVVSRKYMLAFGGQSLPYTALLFKKSVWICIPLALILGRFSPIMPHFSLGEPDQIFWLALTFAVVGATALNYFLTGWALLRLPASSVSGLICLQAILGSLWGVIFLGESLTPYHFVSASLVCISVLMLH